MKRAPFRDRPGLRRVTGPAREGSRTPPGITATVKMSYAADSIGPMSSQIPTPEPVGAPAQTVTAWVISRDTARLIDFITDAFGGVELGRIPGPDGGIGHAEIRIGDSVVMMFDARDDWPDTPAFLRLYVADADAAYGRALAAGATSVTEVTGLFFGDRIGRIRDPLGNIWWLQAHVEDVDPAELAQRPSDPAVAEALRYVETSLDAALRS
jgi:PhnB protein